MRIAENRQVTVLNCDLVNSVGLTLELGAEDYSDLLQEFFERVRAALEPWNGFEYATRGDGIYVLFGYPTAVETAAENSVRAALAILAELSLSERFRDKMHARIGIATSMLLFGTITQQEQQEAIGDAMNRVVRLQHLVPPDSIVISDETRLLLGDTFKYESLGLCHLKGYNEPLQAWRVIKERSSATRFNRLRSVYRAPLLGRDHERSILAELWERAQSGAGQIAVVGGEAGIGKSRLVHDLVEKLQLPNRDVCLLQCEPHLQRSHLAPVAAYITQFAGIRHEDPEPAKMEKLAALASEVFENPDDETLFLFGELLSIRTPMKRRYRKSSSVLHLQRMLDGVVRMLLGSRHEVPRLIVIEDLHWADGSSLQLVDRLAEAVSDRSVLLILTTRETDEARMLAGERVTRIPVSPLSETVAAALVTELTSGPKLPANQVRAILNWSDGVPLDIEEHTRIGLLEWSERFSGDSGVASLAAIPGHIGIPPMRRDAIKSQLDRLNSLGQRIAQAAAAIGQDFSLLHLTAALDIGYGELTGGLTELEEATIVERTASKGVYRFRHARYRDAAYESMSRDLRREFHSRIAAFLVREQPEQIATQPELFAHHFESADDAGNAIRYWIDAGNLSSVKGGYLEAVVQYERAAALLDWLPCDQQLGPEAELRLRISLGTAYEVRDGFSCANARAQYERALQLCRDGLSMTASNDLFATYSGYGSLVMVRADFPRALKIADECYTTAVARQSNLGRVIAKRLEGGAKVLQGQLDQGINDLDEAIRLYDLHRNEIPSADEQYALDHKVTAMCYLSLAGLAKGEIKSATETIRRCEEFAKQNTNLHSQNYVLTYRAAMHHLLHDHNQTITIATRSRNMAITHGFASWEGMSRILLGFAFLVEGKSEEGQEEYLLGRKIHEKGMEARQYLPFVISVAARILELDFNIEAALETNDRAIAVSESTSELWYAPELFRLKGELLLKRHSQAEAIECFERARELALSHGSNLWALRSSMNLAKCSTDAASKAQAIEEIAEHLRSLPEIAGSIDDRNCRALFSA